MSHSDVCLISVPEVRFNFFNINFAIRISSQFHKVCGPALKLLCHLQDVVGLVGGEGAHAKGHPIPDHHAHHHRAGAVRLKATKKEH